MGPLFYALLFAYLLKKLSNTTLTSNENATY